MAYNSYLCAFFIFMKKQQLNEIIGIKFGLLIPIKELDNYIQKNGNKIRVFLCKCDCGNEKSIYLQYLKNGHTKSCGCISKNTTPPNKIPIYDLMGLKFGRLTIIGDNDNKKIRKVLCVCDCGKETIVNLCKLKNGGVKSCGCYKKEKLLTNSKTHGLINSPEYKCWCSLKERCLNINNKSYKMYGGKGIKVCDRWINSFENFYADMGNKPTPQHSIDRIDVNGNYEPSNCRWATKIEQMNNTTRNIFYDYNNKKLTLGEIARINNISYNKLWNRVNHKKYSIQDAIML